MVPIILRLGGLTEKSETPVNNMTMISFNNSILIMRAYYSVIISRETTYSWKRRNCEHPN